MKKNGLSIIRSLFRMVLLTLICFFLVACAKAAENKTKTGEPVKTDADRKSTSAQPAKQAEQAERKWDAILAAARQEGTVVFAGPPVSEVRKLVGKFTEKYGIQVDFLSGSGSRHIARLKPEFQAGKYTTDVFMGGPTTVITDMYPVGMLDPIKPDLILPEIGCGHWATKDGCPEFIDKDKQYIVTLAKAVTGGAIFINTKNVKPSEIKSYQDLLKPKFKGRIASADPRTSGPGGQGVNYLLAEFGREFVEKLYKRQQVVLSGDMRQLAEWLARGVYDVVLLVDQESVNNLMQEGLPIAPVETPDAPGKLSGGWLGALARMKNAPHPNAATVFINWVMSKEGLESFGRATKYPVLRKDVLNEWVPKYILPKPDVAYKVDLSSWEYNTKLGPRLEKIRQELFPK